MGMNCRRITIIISRMSRPSHMAQRAAEARPMGAADRPLRGLVLLWVLTGTIGCSPGPARAAEPLDARQYTFSWMFQEDAAMRPRGGTTRGADVKLASEPSDAYRRLVEAGAEVSALERDRRAILAMAGAYRTSFDFIETMGFTTGYVPARPYQSWGTEYVYVVVNEPEFVSLQHILVMTMVDAAGSESDPIVVKHWRQDWRYQDRDLHVYAGHDTWTRRTLAPDQVRGRWSQAVFQVDDSPRYQAVGRWEHHAAHSTWTSGNTWRPLPRREFSVRNDYHVLSGSNRVTVTRLGWVHEEDNLKVVLDARGDPLRDTPYLAREAGLNRYEHIVGHDFSAGDAYWHATAAFWAEVRDAWSALLDGHDTLTLKDEVDGRRLFQVMFELADRFAGDDFDRAGARRAVSQALARFVR